jgi:hypothetical protein
MAVIRSELEADAFAQASVDGESMTLETAASLVLGEYEATDDRALASQ